MSETVYIIGAGRTDFRRNLKKEGKALRDVLLEASFAAIADAGVVPRDIQAGIVGNFAAGLFTRQLHLGAILTEIAPELRGLPCLHIEAACASGGVAVATAAQLVSGGVYDVVLVAGAEQQKTMSPADGADVLAAAADYHGETPQLGAFTFPKLFGKIAEAYRQRHGLTERQLAMVAVKNIAHAALNSCAQMRDAGLTLEQAETESERNPRIAPPLKVSDCSQITDGAAAVVLCSETFLRRLPTRPRARLAGYGMATDHLALADKKVPDFPVPRLAVGRAYHMAGIGPADLHGVDVHDCFTISEIIAYEILGLAETGRGAALLESGATSLPTAREKFTNAKPAISIPVNPGGGLIGDGHPVGATGVRQTADAFRQVTGNAGRMQVPAARRYLIFNVGGSMTTSVVMIWEAAQ